MMKRSSYGALFLMIFYISQVDLAVLIAAASSLKKPRYRFSFNVYKLSLEEFFKQSAQEVSDA
ncbi:hypothetical protein AM231_27835 [Paenibacillus solani]|uniref:Uncharacterized protein n=1 Tax=Paenibacillus solani TaxID=1705565 RepID=A0A0M1N388_9BACL|nr:hypothetical protein AM231_27835 [Paenibacillus solani]